MTKFDRLLEPWIGGSRGAWYWNLDPDGLNWGGGMYYRKSAARMALRNKLNREIPDQVTAKRFLELLQKDTFG